MPLRHGWISNSITNARRHMSQVHLFNHITWNMCVTNAIGNQDVSVASMQFLSMREYIHPKLKFSNAALASAAKREILCKRTAALPFIELSPAAKGRQPSNWGVQQQFRIMASLRGLSNVGECNEMEEQPLLDCLTSWQWAATSDFGLQVGHGSTLILWTSRWRVS